MKTKNVEKKDKVLQSYRKRRKSRKRGKELDKKQEEEKLRTINGEKTKTVIQSYRKRRKARRSEGK